MKKQNETETKRERGEREREADSNGQKVWNKALAEKECDYEDKETIRKRVVVDTFFFHYTLTCNVKKCIFVAFPPSFLPGFLTSLSLNGGRKKGGE
jgi:hypothetical protein